MNIEQIILPCEAGGRHGETPEARSTREMHAVPRCAELRPNIAVHALHLSVVHLVVKLPRLCQNEAVQSGTFPALHSRNYGELL